MKVCLRKIREEDLYQIMIWRMQPSVTKFLNTDPQLDMDMQRAWFKRISESDDCRYWMMVADGVDIGVLGIIDIDHANKRCSWQWYIGNESYRGKGIAKRVQLNLYDYVFYKMGMHRLYSHILTFNTHEIDRVHIACGYKVEGVMKDHVYKNGKFIDVTVMGITEDMWAEIKPDFHYEQVTFED